MDLWIPFLCSLSGWEWVRCKRIMRAWVGRDLQLSHSSSDMGQRKDVGRRCLPYGLYSDVSPSRCTPHNIKSWSESLVDNPAMIHQLTQQLHTRLRHVGILVASNGESGTHPLGEGSVLFPGLKPSKVCLTGNMGAGRPANQMNPGSEDESGAVTGKDLHNKHSARGCCLTAATCR